PFSMVGSREQQAMTLTKGTMTGRAWSALWQLFEDDENKRAREEIESYGLTRSKVVRNRTKVFILSVALITTAGLAGEAVFGGSKDGLDSYKATQMLLTAVTIGFGFWQWRAARHEQSLEKFYERLDRPNQRMIASAGARGLINPEWCADD